MFPHGSNEQVTWRLHGRWILSRGVDCVDLSPRNRNHSTCVKATLSDRDQRGHRSPRGVTRSARASLDKMQRDRDQMAKINPVEGGFVDTSRRSDLHQTSEKHWSTEHDRGRMKSARSSSDGSRWRRAWTASWATMPTISRDRTAGAIRGRVPRDRGSIAPRSGLTHHDRGLIEPRSWFI